MRQQRVWVLIFLMLGLAACGTDNGTTPPENPPSGGVEVDPAFSVNISNLKPDIVDDYVDGTASYTEQGGIHFISGTATRNEGFSNESTVQLSLQILGELQERTYVYGPEAENGDDVEAEITVIDDGFTSYNATVSQGTLTVSRITKVGVEGGFVLSFDDTRDTEVAAFGDFVAAAASPPTE